MVIWSKLELLKNMGYRIHIPEPGVIEIYSYDEFMGYIPYGKEFIVPHADIHKELYQFGFADSKNIFIKDLIDLEIPYLGDGSELSAEISKKMLEDAWDRQQLVGFDIIDPSNVYVPEKTYLH